jgi:dihydrofolate reductase
MRELVYDVAVSLDGFIAGPDGDVSRFPFEGPHVDAYQARLASYGTVLMGRTTYESGYAWGLKPGERAYPHLDHVVMSSSLSLPAGSDVCVSREPVADVVARLKAEPGPAIYLCGGGLLAGALAQAGLIDRLCLKVAPIVIGAGVRLFEGLSRPLGWHAESCVNHPNGVNTCIYKASAGS